MDLVNQTLGMWWSTQGQSSFACPSVSAGSWDPAVPPLVRHEQRVPELAGPERTRPALGRGPGVFTERLKRRGQLGSPAPLGADTGLGPGLKRDR